MIEKKRAYYIFKHLSEIRLYEITDCLNLIESALTNKFQNWGEWFEKETDGWSDADKEDFIDHYYDDLAMIRDTAPNMVRQSMCICLSGYIENFMADFCHFLHRHIPRSPCPKQKLYIEGSMKYLMKIDNFNKEIFDSQQWLFYTKAKYVRDAIVHYNGRLPSHSQGKIKERVNEIKRFVDDTDGIDITTTNDIMIEKSYCENVIDNIKQIIKEFFKTIESRM